MRNLSYSISFLLLMLAFSSCSKKYATSYHSTINNHGTLAILPFEVHLHGEIPRNLSREEVQEIEEAESLNFQASLYYQFLEDPLFRRNRQWVNFQHYRTTNDKLEAAEIDIRAAWEMEPEAIAEILGVDAVVHTQVDIEHQMRRGVAIAIRVLDIPPIFDPHNWGINNRMFVYSSIMDGQTGQTVWTHSVNTTTDPYRSPRRAMDEMNLRIARNFPYKNYRY